MNVDGAVVLVTGASSGIGRATAVELAGRGARLVVSGRDEAALEQVAKDCDGVALAADLGRPESCAQLAERSVGVHGRVDVLVANAGVGSAEPFQDVEAATIERLLQVNLVAPMLLARALLPGMLERRQGHVVLVGSIAGLTGVAGEAAYSASKGGLAIFAEALRLECHGREVGVSHVVPGVVETAFFERRGVPYTRRTPRPVAPERIARAVRASIERDRAETVVPGWLSLAVKARALSPSGYRFLARRFGGS